MIIGIIGSKYKVVTSHILDEILRSAGYKTSLIGAQEYKLNNIMEKIKNEYANVTLVEIPLERLKQFNEYEIDVDILIHIDTELDEEIDKKYLSEKIKLFNSLKKNKIAILNIDDSSSLDLISQNKDIMIISYGFNSKASITASSLTLDKSPKFNLCLQRGITSIYGRQIEPLEHPIRSNLLGRINIYNTLASISACFCLDIDLDIISDTLLKLDGSSRMLKKIYDKEFTIIDCFTQTPSNYENVFDTIQNLDYNKLTIVKSISNSKSYDTNKKIASTISEWKGVLDLEKIILISHKISDKITECYEKVLNENDVSYKIYDNLESGIRNGLKQLNKDDIFLLLGGEEMNRVEESIRLINEK